MKTDGTKEAQKVAKDGQDTTFEERSNAFVRQQQRENNARKNPRTDIRKVDFTPPSGAISALADSQIRKSTGQEASTAPSFTKKEQERHPEAGQGTGKTAEKVRQQLEQKGSQQTGR